VPVAVAERTVVRIFDAGGGDTPNEVHNRILTVPNVLSLLRLLILPWLYLLIVDGQYLTGLVVAGVFASTDWLDGWVARRFDQVTRFGKMLDPASDRLFIITMLVAMVVAGLVPWWLAAALVARDVLLLVGSLFVLESGATPPPVTYLGKFTTFLLMSSFPVLLFAGHLAQQDSSFAEPLRIIGLVGACVAAVLYWWLAVGYGRAMLAARRAAA